MSKPATMQVNIVSAEKQIFNGVVEQLYATALMGEVGVLPGHTPLISPLKSGQVRLKLQDGEESIYYIDGGMLEVQPGYVTVLADTAIRADDLDEKAAFEAKEKAEKALGDRKADMEYAAVIKQLNDAVAKIQVIERIKRKLKT